MSTNNDYYVSGQWLSPKKQLTISPLSLDKSQLEMMTHAEDIVETKQVALIIMHAPPLHYRYPLQPPKYLHVCWLPSKPSQAPNLIGLSIKT